MDYNYQKPIPPPPRYVMLAEQGGSESMNIRPPPNRRNLPRYYSERSKKSSCCSCGCLCWFCCFLFIFIIIIAALVVYFVLIYNPKIPSYSVSNLSIGSFEFRPQDFTLHTKLIASVRAENPNEMIGIKYGSGSRVVISYHNSTLSSGHLPSFYQGYKNVTVMQISMEGTHSYGSGLIEALDENKKKGSVPLEIHVRVPVSLRLGTIDLREVAVNVRCALVVDSLSPGKKPKILSATYQVNVEF
ncbi:hypothetical protein LUZ60_008679 [Juncus effusus]|nr:hypothetical protein LUZ60_008679 [Juncus effusus]